jgi:acyl carrier protein
MVQELLGRDVDPEEPLMEAGLDSMSAVELHSGVQQTMGVELPATLISTTRLYQPLRL